VDDVFGESYDTMEKTEGVICESCGHKEAYFKQIQIRSADEPMTIFYKCTNKKCGHKWREG